jgi:hypothetical protein
MRKLLLCLPVLALGPAAASAARADGNVTTMSFAVTRDGEPIGSSTVRLHRDGDRTVAETATNVRVRIAYVTVYRFEERQTERWVGGRLAALHAVTDDNGRVHEVSATRRGDTLSVIADGKTRDIDPAVIPASLWNPSLLRSTAALDTRDGSVIPVSVVDRGKERIVLHGRPTTAHRYSIRTSFPQEVWYDEQQRLLKVELRGSDGSTIRYQPG